MPQTLFTTIDWFELSVFLGLLLIIAPLLGRYMAAVFEGEQTPLYPYFSFVEKTTYHLCGIDPLEEMTWQVYLRSVIAFSLCGIAFLFLLLVFQDLLPGNPQHYPGLPWNKALSTAISSVTKTSWQLYAGETTLSNTSQMVGLTVQTFASAGVSTGVLLALIRSFTRNKEQTLGNFWVDFTRTLIYVLLPLSILVALILTVQGTVQSLDPFVEAVTLENQIQIIPLGPIATQVASGQLSSNGGGIFNVGEAHPLANPTAFSNFVEAFSILLIPASLPFTYAQMIRARRQGWILFYIMLLLLILGTLLAIWGQDTPNPILENTLNQEGQETRFGEVNTLLWMAAATGTSCGSVNGTLTSLSPLAGGAGLMFMMLGEISFGGAGTGLSLLLTYVLLTVFLAGLLVGRTPEFLGKKIERSEMGWILLALFGPGIVILIVTALALLLPITMQSIGNPGPHGYTEVLYAFTSTVRNNGSVFSSFNCNSVFYQTALNICMLLGRLAFLVPTLVLAGKLVQKRITPPSIGTFATDNLPFGILLFAVILLMNKLIFGPAFFLGPVMEHLLMLQGRAF